MQLAAAPLLAVVGGTPAVSLGLREATQHLRYSSTASMLRKYVSSSRVSWAIQKNLRRNKALRTSALPMSRNGRRHSTVH